MLIVLHCLVTLHPDGTMEIAGEENHVARDALGQATMDHAVRLFLATGMKPGNIKVFGVDLLWEADDAGLAILPRTLEESDALFRALHRRLLCNHRFL